MALDFDTVERIGTTLAYCAHQPVMVACEITYS